MPVKFLNFLLVNLFLFLFSFSFFTPLNVAQANPSDDGYGLDKTKDEVDGLRDDEVSELLGSIIGAVLAFVGVLFFILVVYGGLLWMTARGNDQQIEKAKNLIGAAVVGLVIVLSAYAITAFIGTTLTE